MDGKQRQMAEWLAAAIVASVVVLVGMVSVAGRPVAAAPAGPAGKPDAAAAKAEFEAAGNEMRELMAELTVLQAQYHQPAADKAVVENRFKQIATQAQAASDRLEAAALALAVIDPNNADARQINVSAAAGAVKADAPDVALDKVKTLDAAGAASPDALLVAAEAARILARLDEATQWLEKARAAGARKDRADEVEDAIAHDRPKVDAEMAKRQAEAAADDLPRVKISTTVGDVVVELFENEAPNTVANFISLVEKGFYDGTPFHRVIGGFMAQGGDPKGTGAGGPGYTIACEVAAPGARQHFLGTLSMAHAGPDTGGSQFFLTFRPTVHLDGKHTVFGRVIEGFEVLPKIMRTTDEQGRTVEGVQPDRIVKAEVLRKRNHPYVPKTQPDTRAR
jgi:cyclophilin family peptidyl-prolyl cis-trans isomerase